MKFYVYILYRPWNNEPCYVGKGQGDRVNWHFQVAGKHYNRRLANILKKAGGIVPHQIVFQTDNEQEALTEEIRLIAFYGRADLGLGPLCNLTNGGEGTSGVLFTEERRSKMSAALKGRTFSDETLAKMRLSANGKVVSSETRARMSAAHIGKKLSADTIEKMRKTKTGQKFTAEHCANIGKSKLGQVVSEETREKVRIGSTGRHYSAETRARIGEGHRGKTLTEAHKAQVRAFRLGTKASEETRRKMSEAGKRRWADRKASQ